MDARELARKWKRRRAFNSGWNLAMQEKDMLKWKTEKANREHFYGYFIGSLCRISVDMRYGDVNNL